MLESDIAKHIRDAGVAGAVSETVGVYTVFAPQSAAVPYIVVTQLGSDPGYHAAGSDGLRIAEVRVSCHANTPADAAAIGEEVRKMFDGKTKGAINDTNARGTMVDDIRNGSISPAHGQEFVQAVTELDITIMHTVVKGFG